MRIFVIVMLVLIVVSLFSALFYVYKGRDVEGSQKRVVRALTIRVGLSLALFVFLMVSYKMGWISSGRL